MDVSVRSFESMKRWIAFRARVKESRVVLEGVDLAGGHRVEKAVECLRRE